MRAEIEGSGNGQPVWLDGAIVPRDDAAVSIFDHGVTVGDGVFETMRTERGRAFAVSRHLRRLRRGLDGLGLRLERTDEELRAALHEVAAAAIGPAKVRLTVTGGRAPLGSGRGEATPTVMIAAEPLTAWTPTGASVTVDWRRNEHSPVAGLKTTSYAENVVALARAKAAGAGEAIFANTAGRLCEGTGSNVFVVQNGTVRTPPLDSGCLAGITREIVLEVLDVPGVAIEEADLPLAALGRADEVFLTSSTRDVQGQHRVDDRDLDAPGPVTAAVADAFARLAGVDDDP